MTGGLELAHGRPRLGDDIDGERRNVCGTTRGLTIIMLDHSGRNRERYEDAFRAIGNYLDTNRFSQIVVVETPEGFLIKGLTLSGVDAGDRLQMSSETYLFANEDIDAIVEAAYDRRKP